jgi:hypothetical protein
MYLSRQFPLILTDLSFTKSILQRWGWQTLSGDIENIYLYPLPFDYRALLIGSFFMYDRICTFAGPSCLCPANSFVPRCLLWCIRRSDGVKTWWYPEFGGLRYRLAQGLLPSVAPHQQPPFPHLYYGGNSRYWWGRVTETLFIIMYLSDGWYVVGD